MADERPTEIPEIYGQLRAYATLNSRTLSKKGVFEPKTSTHHCSTLQSRSHYPNYTRNYNGPFSTNPVTEPSNHEGTYKRASRYCCHDGSLDVGTRVVKYFLIMVVLVVQHALAKIISDGVRAVNRNMRLTLNTPDIEEISKQIDLHRCMRIHPRRTKIFNE